MKVTCPQCRTVYRLPDEKANSGVKLRCSVCRHVFTLPEPELEDGDLQYEDSASTVRGESLTLGGSSHNGLNMALEDSGKGVLDNDSFENPLHISAPAEDDRLDELEEKKRGPLDGAFSLLLVIGLIFGGIWAWKHTSYLDEIKTLIMPYFNQEDSAPVEPATLLEKLEIRDWRQYLEKNEKLGSLIVIEGKVKNNFTTPRELIRLEAQLFDSKGNVLASKQQLAGASLSSFHLKVLDKEELEKALNNKIDIIASNVDVMPGGEVPFMIVFTNIPEGACDFKLRIVEASIPKLSGNLSN